MSWIGGKKALRELIVTLFPVYYERYIEVFGGGGWVLFHKPPGNDFEVYNDFNGLLVNLYRCVRDKPEELIAALKYVLNAREDFDFVRGTLARDSPASDVQKAAWFYQLIRYSYAAGLTSFGSQPHDMWSNFPLIEQAHRRLAKVVIENKDFEKLLRQYDRPVSFFYLDPPYHATEGYYQNIGEDGFTEADHIRLRDTLMRIEGKFLLSYHPIQALGRPGSGKCLPVQPGREPAGYLRVHQKFCGGTLRQAAERRYRVGDCPGLQTAGTDRFSR